MLVRLVAAIVTVAVLVPNSARADGETGVVVVWGDGSASAVCVPFEGDNVDGGELLAAAAFSLNEFSGLICSIDGVGCTHSGTFGSCLCQCAAGSGDCVYWSFFTRRYGEPWSYAATGFRANSASNGDLHAWQWLPASSAAPPAPPTATFEDVCGHPPVAATPNVPVGSPPATSAPTVPAASSSPTILVPMATLVSASPTAGMTAEPTVQASPGEGITSSTTPEPPLPPSTGDADAGGGRSLVLFAVVAGSLVLAIGGALALRGRHDR